MSSGVGPHRTVECGPGSLASRILILNVSQSSRECREVDNRKRMRFGCINQLRTGTMLLTPPKGDIPP